MGLKAVLFDLDGVIADTEPLHARAYVAAFGECGVRIDAETYRRAVTVGGKQAYAWYAELGGTAPEQHLYALKDECFRDLLRGLVPLHGVPQLLDDLHGHGVQLAIGTGSRQRVARSVLEALGLAQYFRGIVAKDQVFRMKPDPEVYHRALNLLGASPAEAAVIEDSPHGVRAGKAAGAFTVAVPTSSTCQADFSAADLVVSSLSELSARALAERLYERRVLTADDASSSLADCTIRLALPCDVPAIVDLLNQVTLHLHSKGIMQWAYPWDPGDVEVEVRKQRVHLLVSGSRIIGCFSIRDTGDVQLPLVPPGCLYLYSVALSPTFSGQRLGARMIESAIECSRLAGQPLYLDCRAGNTVLRDYYSRAGFEFLGDVPERDYHVSVFRYGK